MNKNTYRTCEHIGLTKIELFMNAVNLDLIFIQFVLI